VSLRLMVIGGYGFIGSAVARAASAAGVEVQSVHFRQPSDLQRRIAESFDPSPVHRVEVPPHDVERLAHAFAAFSPNAVVSAVGSVARRHTLGWSEHVASNTGFLAELIDAVVVANLPETPSLIVIGSQLEFGDAAMPWTEDTIGSPSDAYGASKLAGTNLVVAARSAGIVRTTVVRVPIVFGPGQAPRMLIPQLLVAALRGERVEMSEGTQLRRTIGSTNLARLLLELADRATAEDLPALLNLPAFAEMPVREIGSLVLRLVGNPSASLAFGARPMRPGEAMHEWPDDQLAKQLGFRIDGDVETAMQATIGWYRSNAGLFS